LLLVHRIHRVETLNNGARFSEKVPFERYDGNIEWESCGGAQKFIEGKSLGLFAQISMRGPLRLKLEDSCEGKWV
jgi:hypothetical protein